MRERTLSRLILMGILGLQHLAILPHTGAMVRVGSAVLVALVGLFALYDVLWAALLFLASTSIWLILPRLLLGMPAIPFLVPFIVSTVFIAPFPKLRGQTHWLRAGDIDRASLLWILATSVSATAALLLWAFWTHNLGIGEQMVRAIPPASPWLIYGIGVPAFAMINAVSEELYFRGVIQEAAMRSFGSSYSALAIQSVSFAAVHFTAGFPNGYWGYGMTFAFAWMLGFLRIKTRGILAPWIAHVAADLCIGYFLAWHAGL